MSPLWDLGHSVSVHCSLCGVYANHIRYFSGLSIFCWLNHPEDSLRADLDAVETQSPIFNIIWSCHLRREMQLVSLEAYRSTSYGSNKHIK